MGFREGSHLSTDVAHSAPENAETWSDENELIRSLRLNEQELHALHNMSEISLRPGSLREVCQDLVEEISNATSLPIVLIKHPDARTGKMVLDAAFGLASPVDENALELPMDETLSGTVIRTGQTFVQTHVWGQSEHGNRSLERLGVKTLLIVPMIVNQEVVGALTLAHPEVIELREQLIRTSASLANYVASLISRKRIEQSLVAAQAELEERVAARTRELEQINIELKQEIERRQETEQALRDSEARWKSLIVNAPSVIVTVDADGKVLYASKSVSECAFAPQEDENLFDLLRGDERAPLRDALATVTSHPGNLSLELRLAGGRGAEWLSAHIGSLVTTRKTSDAMLVLTDITEQRLLQEQLRQSQKMEAIGQLAGGVAHDFNNLLTVIKGYSQFIAMNLPPDAACILPDLEEIHLAVDRAARLTRQLLAFSRRQMLKMQFVDVNQVIQNMVAMLERILGEDILIDLSLMPDLGLVLADPGQIEQMILNLSVNARDAMPDGGMLIIETGRAVVDEDFAANHIDFQPGEYVRIVVSDTGTGMTPEVREHLFEPFFTTKEPGKGTGLGLATVYGIVKQFGGSIYVYSELVHGSTFKIYLPHQAQASASITTEETHELCGGHEKILVVEDEAEVRIITASLLERLGYQVIQAANGQDALELMSQSRNKVDLVLTDIIMPGMNGKQLADSLLNLYPDLAVLFTSGYTDHAIVHQGVIEPGLAFLEKPFAFETLARQVRRVLDARARIP